MSCRWKREDWEQQAYLDDRMMTVIFVFSVFVHINVTVLYLDLYQLPEMYWWQTDPRAWGHIRVNSYKKKGIDTNDTEGKNTRNDNLWVQKVAVVFIKESCLWHNTDAYTAKKEEKLAKSVLVYNK